MTTTDDTIDPTDDTHVPPGASAHVCERCGRPFADEEYLSLHRGLDHAADLSAAEREAFEAAHESEVADLQRFRLLALAALVALYFGFLMTYAVVT
ncbi:DNA-binding protein [Haloplanus salilacus]|uniref:DNA-binding protein n=1 Tax=Haloplanus salilacus TaxID=2949994 RepID=UPI0030D4A348